MSSITFHDLTTCIFYLYFTVYLTLFMNMYTPKWWGDL